MRVQCLRPPAHERAVNQIIVDQGGGVEQFDGRGGKDSLVHVRTTEVSGEQHQRRTDSFPASIHQVIHRYADGLVLSGWSLPQEIFHAL